MRIGFIGAGKVATVMGAYWLANGVNMVGYFSRNSDSAVKAAAIANTGVFTSMVALADAVDLLMITTNDDAIGMVAETLTDLPLDWGNKIVCHMSGALSSEILTGLYRRGATVCSLHPLISFNSPTATPELKKVLFTFEGRGCLLEAMIDFLDRLGHRYEQIHPEQKTLYHAAACIVSNYGVTLWHTGIEMFRHLGFAEENIVPCLKPLVEKTWENICEAGVPQALTGPISRGDSGTVRLHLQGLLREGRREWLEIYRTMGAATVDLALQAGRIDPATANNLYRELIIDG